MATTKIKLNQLVSTTNPGSLVVSDASNIYTTKSPTLGADHIWFYDHSATDTVPLTLGTNLSISGTVLNATAGAGGYATIQEEGVTVGASNTTINFIGSAFTAADATGGVTSVTANSTLNSIATAGNVSVANGGTGVGTLTGILQGNGTGAITGITNSSTVGQILRVTGASTYAWGALDLADTDAVTGLLPYANIASLTGLSVLGRSTNSSGVMAAVTGTTDQVLRVDAGGTALGFGAINLAAAAAVTGVLDEVNGGTGNSTYAIGDLLYADTTASLARRAAVASGSVLKSAGVSTAPVWGTLASTDLSDTSNIVLLTGNQTISGTKTVTSLTISGTPSASTDAATVGYVTTAVAGLRKGSVRAATTVNGTLASAYANGSVIDGVTLATGDLILLKNQSTQAENGVYTVNVAGAPTRATWMDAASEIDGVYVAVEDGTTLGGTLWITVSEVTTLGTDAIVFTQIQTSGGLTGTGVDNQIAVWQGASALDGNSTFTWNQTQMTVGTATPVASARVTIAGSGTGAGTSGLVVVDSTTAERLRISDSGVLTVNNAGNPLTLQSGSILFTGGSNNIIDSAASAADGLELKNASGGIKLSPNSGSTSGSLGFITMTAGTSGVQNSLTNNQGIVSITGTFSPSGAGTNTFKSVNITPTINQTTHTGITRGIHLIPTITAAADFRALEITANSSHYALWTTAGKVRYDLGSDANFDTYYRGTGGELIRLANGTTGQVLTATTSAAPTWAAAAGGITTTVCYVTGTGTATYDLDAGVVAKDVDGAAFVFTVPANLDLVDVYRNGVMLSRSGSVSRDYTLTSATGVLVLASVLASDEELKIVKRV